MSVFVVHPTGNANVRAVLRGLVSLDLLGKFFTTIALPEAKLVSSRLPEKWRRKLSRRQYLEVDNSKIDSHAGREIIRLLAGRVGWGKLIDQNDSWASVTSVYRDLDQRVASVVSRLETKPKAIYAYEDGAVESFRAAKRNDVKRIYDLPVVHWATVRKILEDEVERSPEWVSTLTGLKDGQEKLERKDEEVNLASHIFVASSFSKKSVESRFGSNLPISVVSYGCPPATIRVPARRQNGEPLRILFAGHLTQQKGIADLIAALQLAKIHWRLVVVGRKPLGAPLILEKFLADPRCTWLGVLPHRTLLEEMTKAHAFVFPSLFEGFGMVLSEALSAGVPIITTPNTAGPDLLGNTQAGFIVPIRAPEAIAESITYLYDDEPRRLGMGVQALGIANRNPWSIYSRRIASTVAGLI